MIKVLVAALLAAPLPGSAQAADPQPDELLQIAFPGWKDEEGGRVVSIPTSAATRGWEAKQGRKRHVAIAPRAAVRAAPDRIVLLASMTPVDESGFPQVAHGTPAGLAAYTFKPGKAGWKLARRQEPFDLQGFEGRVRVDSVELPGAGRAAHVHWGSCWQGRCVDVFALYRIGADGVQAKPMLVEKTAGNNVYARPDCVARLQGLLGPMQPPDGQDEQAPPGQCYEIASGWQVAPGRVAGMPGALTLRFRGAASAADKDGNRPAQAVDQEMKFEFRGGRYVPVSGSNPVPNA